MSDVPKVGDTLLDRYELVEEIGRGGFGIVFRATQLGMSRDVAVKVLVIDEGGGQSAEETRERFRREAMVARNLNHPHTIRQYDFGETEDGMMFLVLEFLDGRNLVEVIREEGALGDKRVRSIAEGALKSLGEAHAQGIVHRDLKPGNIMLCKVFGETDFVKVLDFGIAKKVMGDTDITQAGVAMGSPRYIPPELLRGERPSPASDLYSLGITLAEATIGKPLLPADFSAIDLARVQLSPDPLPVPDELRETDLWPWLSVAIKKDPVARWENAEVMLQHLDDTPEMLAEFGADVLDLKKTNMLPAVQLPDYTGPTGDFHRPRNAEEPTGDYARTAGERVDTSDITAPVEDSEELIDGEAPTMLLSPSDSEKVAEKYRHDSSGGHLPVPEQWSDEELEEPEGATLLLDQAALEAGRDSYGSASDTAGSSHRDAAAEREPSGGVPDDSLSIKKTSAYQSVGDGPDTIREKAVGSEGMATSPERPTAIDPSASQEQVESGTEQEAEVGLSTPPTTDRTEMVSVPDQGFLETDSRGIPKFSAESRDQGGGATDSGAAIPGGALQSGPSPASAVPNSRASFRTRPPVGPKSETGERAKKVGEKEKNQRLLILGFIAIAAIGLIAAVSLAMYTYLNSGKTTEVSPKVSVPDEPPPPVDEPGAKAAEAEDLPEEPKVVQREFSIKSEPKGATLSIGGEEKGQAPLDFRIPSDQLPLIITLQLEGYETKTATLDSEAPDKILFELEKKPKKVVEKEKKPAKKPVRKKRPRREPKKKKEPAKIEVPLFE